MKTKKIKVLMFAAILSGFAACSDEWLKPDALSFFTPENTFVDVDGITGALIACERQLRNEFYNDAAPIVFEYLSSDVCVDGGTDMSRTHIDMNLLLTPTGLLNSTEYSKVGWYWTESYYGLKYANTVINRIDVATYKDEAERNGYLSMGYFHRAYLYYRLTHQFGDVPYVGNEVMAPKTDYYSTKREVILQSIKKDMEFAAQWGIVNADIGLVSRGACGHLLTKINLALALFDDAIASATAVIEGGQYSLMTNRFGIDANNTNKNVIWDLHRGENKSILANRECLKNVISRESNPDGSDRIQTMRHAVPFWSASGGNAIRTPNGKTGLSTNTDIEYEYVKTYGRGVSKMRPTPYFSKMIWDLDDTDLRHQRSWYDDDGVFQQGNWMEMEDMVYNNPSLLNPASAEYSPEWYGKPLQFQDDEGVVLTADTIRNWHAWPHYKVFVPDPTQSLWIGGRTDWYIYRLAETYLLRAEAYFWKGEMQRAADDINMVRRRAQAREISASEVNMRMILDERARELYYEEPRKSELTRIAFIYAQTGKPADDGTVYSLSNFSEKNFWYDHIMSVEYFRNKGVETMHADVFTMSPFHVLWPVPQESINSNVNGVINQNKGYLGYENNVPPLDVIE